MPFSCTTTPSGSIRPPFRRVVDDIPVDPGDVRAAEVVVGVSEREMDGPVHLLVEQRVPHVLRDPRVAADAELTQRARTLVGVERLQQKLLVGRCARVGDAPPSKRSRIPLISRPANMAGNSVNAISPSAESSTGHPKNSPPGTLLPGAATRIDRPASDRRRSVPSPTTRTSSASSKCPAWIRIRSPSSSQSMRQAPKRKSSNPPVLIRASWASAGVGY